MNHHGKIATSELLQSLKLALDDDAWHTSLDLATKVNTVAIGSSVSALRTNGFNVETKYAGLSAGGRKMFAYRLLKETLLTQMDFFKKGFGGRVILK